MNAPKTYEGLVYTHIPKCGGSSLRRLIYETSREAGIEEKDIYIPGEGGLAHDRNLGQLDSAAFDAIKSEKKKIVAEHSKYKEARVRAISPDNPFRITFLRRPLDRFISHYNFFCFQQGHGNCKDIPLTELPFEKFEQLINEMANVQTAYILNIAPGPSTLDISADAQNHAFRILESEFHHVGVLDELETSMKLLKTLSPEWLPFNKEFPVVNKTKVNPESSIDTDFVHAFNKVNMLDIRLYRFALEMLKMRSRFLIA